MRKRPKTSQPRESVRFEEAETVRFVDTADGSEAEPSHPADHTPADLIASIPLASEPSFRVKKPEIYVRTLLNDSADQNDSRTDIPSLPAARSSSPSPSPSLRDAEVFTPGPLDALKRHNKIFPSAEAEASVAINGDDNSFTLPEERTEPFHGSFACRRGRSGKWLLNTSCMIWKDFVHFVHFVPGSCSCSLQCMLRHSQSYLASR